MKEYVVLVDENDRVTGMMEKLEVHQKGLLHRAFSVFVYNLKGELLLQQRDRGKYHSGGLWSNTCCSHPRPGEDSLVAATRRLKEEMGMEVALKFYDKFIYKTVLSNGLTEHELDYIYIGFSDEHPQIDLNEVQAWKYIDKEGLLTEMQEKPGLYTEWLKLLCSERVEVLSGSDFFQF